MSDLGCRQCGTGIAEPETARIGAPGIDRLAKLAEHFEARHREHVDAASAQADSDASRPERASGAVYRMCAEQLRDVIADLASPTAEDFDRAAEQIATRYALVEQLGHRAMVGTVREITYCGKTMLEVQRIDIVPSVTVRVNPDSFYDVTDLTADQAAALARTYGRSTNGLDMAGVVTRYISDRQLAAAEEDVVDATIVDDDDDIDPDEGKDDGMSAAEREEYDRDAEFRLDAADEARDLERQEELDNDPGGADEDDEDDEDDL